MVEVRVFTHIRVGTVAAIRPPVEQAGGREPVTHLGVEKASGSPGSSP